jgi:Uma2 family endonuclease
MGCARLTRYDALMTAAQSPKRVAYVDFLRMTGASEEKHEWVDGVVYAMSRGTPEHGRLGTRIVARAIAPLLDEGCEGFSSDTAIFIEAAKHHTYADASLVCGPIITRTVRDRNGKSIGEAITNPVLIIEVLSESTERYDRDGKFEAYKQLPSFEEYVLVSQDERRIEVRTLETGAWFTRVGGPGETVRIHGREIAVDSVYG